jgi:triosephosphate isomerase (TIM)
MRPLIAGNWKMNGLEVSLVEIDAIARAAEAHASAADILVCPPATLLARAVAIAEGRIAIGGQDCHERASGAFTGDLSAEMLKDAGASAVIVGHSERRHYHNETDAIVAAKARAAWRAGLIAIVCVGETQAQRDGGDAAAVVAAQILGSVPEGANGVSLAIAYEPVWAIGSGLTPSVSEITAMHGHIRAQLKSRLGPDGSAVRVLYGGSVKPENARVILGIPHVNGALVGGASLKALEFQAIFSSAAPQA